MSRGAPDRVQPYPHNHPDPLEAPVTTPEQTAARFAGQPTDPTRVAISIDGRELVIMATDIEIAAEIERIGKDGDWAVNRDTGIVTFTIKGQRMMGTPT